MSTKFNNHSYGNIMKGEINFRLPKEPYTKDFENRLILAVQKESQNTPWALIIPRMAVFLGSITSIYFVVVSLGRSMVSSGFYDYASIIFLDFNSAVIYAKEISISLVESLPIFSVLLFSALVATFVWSTKSMKRLGMFGFYHKQRAFN